MAAEVNFVHVTSHENALYIGIQSMASCQFVMEPKNVTVTEGDTIKLFCSMAVLSNDIATWVINGLEYYWTDLSTIEGYRFNLRDNSLTIHNSSHWLDGSSFRCILNDCESRVGYLTVNLPSTQSSMTDSTSGK